MGKKDQIEEKWLADRVKTPTVGKWCMYFQLTKTYAEDNNIPLIAMWTNKGCSVCKDVIADKLNSDAFVEWAENESKCVFCVTQNGGDANTKDIAECKKFV